MCEILKFLSCNVLFFLLQAACSQLNLCYIRPSKQVCVRRIWKQKAQVVLKNVRSAFLQIIMFLNPFSVTLMVKP